jgi:uncharacterized protein (UPF0333 family)
MLLALVLLIVIGVYYAVTQYKAATVGNVTIEGKNESPAEALNESLNKLRNVSPAPAQLGYSDSVL